MGTSLHVHEALLAVLTTCIPDTPAAVPADRGTRIPVGFSFTGLDPQRAVHRYMRCRSPMPGSQGTGISATQELTPEVLDLDVRAYSTRRFIPYSIFNATNLTPCTAFGLLLTLH